MNIIEGDATYPIGPGNKLIIHVTNNIGKWGKGFVLALSNRWKEPQEIYMKKKEHLLGDVDFVSVSNNNITVANMCAQNGINRPGEHIQRVDYGGLRICLQKIKTWCDEHPGTTVHMPKIGAGLGGGDWNMIESIIKDELVGIDIYVYIYASDQNLV